MHDEDYIQKVENKGLPHKIQSHTDTDIYRYRHMSEVGREKKGETGGEGGRHERKKLYEVEKPKNSGGKVAYQWKDQ